MSYRRKRRFEPIVFVGLLATLLIHGAGIGGMLYYREHGAGNGCALSAGDPPPPPQYVVARLIRKGKPLDKRKLPNKVVPQRATKKPTAVDLSANASDAPNAKKKRDKRDRSDRERDALGRIEELVKAQREIEQEGAPEGAASGSATASEGDRYMTRIADIWNRTWSLPAVIDRAQAKTLYALVVVKIDRQGNIEYPIQFDRRSGNAHFDNSIVVAWGQIKRIPVPPSDRFAAVLANGLALKLTWRGMQ